MIVESVHPDRISQQDAGLWRTFQRRTSGADSPFLSLEFARAVAAYRDDVEVAVMRDGQRTLGFLPLHRDASNVGHPIGLRLADLQGPVLAPGLAWTPGRFVREAQLVAWRFNHLATCRDALTPYCWGDAISPVIDLSGGFAAYLAARRHAGSQLVTQIMRKSRKLAREVGPLRFEWNTFDRRVFDSLMTWKSEQRRQTATFDVLSVDWVVELLERLRHRDSLDMSGVVSALYAGERLVAVHLGLRSRRVLHVWFPAFDQSVAPKYSPGLVMVLEMLKAGARDGIELVHLGKGDQQYKRGLMTGAWRVAAGCVTERRVKWALGSMSFRTRRWLRESPLHNAVDYPKQLVRSWHLRTQMR